MFVWDTHKQTRECYPPFNITYTFSIKMQFQIVLPNISPEDNYLHSLLKQRTSIHYWRYHSTPIQFHFLRFIYARLQRKIGGINWLHLNKVSNWKKKCWLIKKIFRSLTRFQYSLPPSFQVVSFLLLYIYPSHTRLQSRAHIGAWYTRVYKMIQFLKKNNNDIS